MNDVCTDQEMVELLRRAQRHDGEAFETLYELYADKLFRYIWSRVGDQATAEDLMMDVFVKAVEHIPRFRIPRDHQVAAFSAWLFRIANHTITDHRRKRARADRHEVTWLDRLDTRGVDTMSQAIAHLSDQSEIRRALEQLNEEQREVIRCRFLAELSIAETAAVMRKSEGAIKALQHRALKSLRRVLTRPAKLRESQ